MIFERHYMFKILIINTTIKKGGAAKIANSLFCYTGSNLDHKTAFAYGRGLNSGEKNSFYFGNKLELFIHIFLVRFFGLEGFGSYFATRKLISFIKKEKFDIVHIHNLHGYYINFFKLLSWLSKNNIKVIWTLHDEWILTWLPAHSMGCDHCISGQGRCINTYTYPKNYFPIFKKLMIKKKRNIFNYNNIVFVSPADWLSEKIKKYYPKADIALIKNGIDTNNFYPKEKKELRVKYNIPIDKKIILFSAANLSDVNKGMNYVLGLLDTLNKEKYHFVSFGQGSIGDYSNLTNFGFISDNNLLSDIYSLSDVYLFLSLAETAPLSVLEAVSCNTPVVAFDLPANGIIEKYNFGGIVKEKSISSIIETLNKILDNNIMINSNEVIKKEFDAIVMKNNYLNLYENLDHNSNL